MRTRKRAATPKARLKVGAWYSIVYGFSRKDVCVVQIAGDRILVEHPDWNLSGAKWMTEYSLFKGVTSSSGFFIKNYHDPKFLGYGRPRWFWGRIRRWTNCFGTLYTKP